MLPKIALSPEEEEEEEEEAADVVRVVAESRRRIARALSPSSVRPSPARSTAAQAKKIPRPMRRPRPSARPSPVRFSARRISVERARREEEASQWHRNNNTATTGRTLKKTVI